MCYVRWDRDGEGWMGLELHDVNNRSSLIFLGAKFRNPLEGSLSLAFGQGLRRPRRGVNSGSDFGVTFLV